MNRTLRLLGLAAVLMLVCGLLGIGPASAGETDPDPMAGAPAVGACYDLNIKQAYGHASPEPTTGCAKRHTMVVTAVGTVPDSFDWSTVDWEHVPKSVTKPLYQTCASATDKLIGPLTRRAKTLYEWYWFAPSKAEIADGARWFSCLITLTDSRGLRPIPKGLPTRLTGSIPNSVARCAKAVKGGYQTVACSQRHQWRTTFTAIVHARPTDKKVLNAARRTCPRHMASDQWLYSGYTFSAKAFVLRCSDKTRR